LIANGSGRNGTSEEVMEDAFRFADDLNLRGVTHLRLTIVPHESGSGTATLTALRLFA
jgi:hypothetical protein